MTKRRRRTDALPSLAGKSVHIVGPHVFQNALLADILSAATGVACHRHALRTALPEPRVADRGERLILEDYLSQEAGSLDGPVLRESRTALYPALVALFNLPALWGGEGSALRRGLRGFFYECDPPEVLVKGVRRIFAGELWVSRRALAASFEEPDAVNAARKAPPSGLTQREQEILRLIAEGATNETVAEKMCISGHTVKTHLYNAYRKISVKNRVQAARWTEKNLG